MKKAVEKYMLYYLIKIYISMFYEVLKWLQVISHFSKC